ncbi:hypothetical protein MAR_038105, partial [Mya arenaria]
VNHLVQTDGTGLIVHMDVIHDEDEKTVMAIIGDVSQYAIGVHTINLHDYNTGYGVLKDINRDICTLTKSPIPMQPSWKYRMGITNEVHHHKLIPHPDALNHSSVEKLAGPKIASFCYDYTTFYAEVTPIDPKFHAWCFLSACSNPILGFNGTDMIG